MASEGYPAMSQNTLVETQQNNTEVLTDFKVKEIHFDGRPGLGFGLGSIDRLGRLKSGDIDQETMQRGDEFIVCGKHNFLRVNIDDTGNIVKSCGCIDGRSAKDKVETRYKLAGGTLVHTVAGIIGAGHLHNTYQEQLTNARDFMQFNNIEFGGHTDNTADESKTGCGAVDNLPGIIANTQIYRNQIKYAIRDIIEAAQLDYLAYDSTLLDQVLDNYKQFFEATDFTGYNGNFAKNLTESSQGLITNLDNSEKHKECALVINLVEGITLNQKELEKITDGKYQAFSYDVPAAMQIAQKIGRGNDTVATLAFYGELVYTIAAKATLTNGTQKVFLVSEA
jgi:hypothetical protein